VSEGQEASVPEAKTNRDALDLDDFIEPDNMPADSDELPRKRSDQRETVVHANSTKVLDANLEVFLNPQKLGCLQEETGKLFVVLRANNGISPRFSKYSGVLEWKNCVFLWVNLHCKNKSQYDNEFFEGGKSFVWFGGSRMVEGICSANFVFCISLCNLRLWYNIPFRF
jgi:hypothetical protein